MSRNVSILSVVAAVMLFSVLAVVTVAFAEQEEGRGLGQDKVTLCHNGHLIRVGKPAQDAHLNHRDTLDLEACGDQPAAPSTPGTTDTTGTTTGTTGTTGTCTTGTTDTTTGTTTGTTDTRARTPQALRISQAPPRRAIPPSPVISRTGLGRCRSLRGLRCGHAARHSLR